VKEYVFAAEESVAVAVAALHAEHAANADVTKPAGQLQKKPESTSEEDAEESASMVKEMAV
jgi:hypothetical protein